MVPPIYWNLTSQLGSEVYKEPDVRSAGVTAININGATLQLLAIPPIATSHSTPITRLNNYIISANHTMSYSQLFARATYRRRNTQPTAVIVGVIIGLFGLLVVITLLCNRSNTQSPSDLEAQRARRRQVDSEWSGRRETIEERRTRQAREARQGREARRGEPAPPLYEDVRRQRAPLSRPLSSPPMESNIYPTHHQPAPTLRIDDVRRQRAPLSRPPPDPPMDSTIRPTVQRPAPTLTADDMRRQQAPLSRQLQDQPVPDPDMLPKYEAPPAYDSPAVWSTRG
jgi:hypothetical protein